MASSARYCGVPLALDDGSEKRGRRHSKPGQYTWRQRPLLSTASQPGSGNGGAALLRAAEASNNMLPRPRVAC